MPTHLRPVTPAADLGSWPAFPSLPPSSLYQHAPQMQCGGDLAGYRSLMPSRGARLHPGTDIELSPPPWPLISDARLHPIFVAPTPDVKS